MNRKPLAELIPVLAKSIGSTTAVATGLLAPVALGASGDLDPEFADGGRLGPIPELNGAGVVGRGARRRRHTHRRRRQRRVLLLLVRMRPTCFRTSRAYSPRTAGSTRHSRAGDQRCRSPRCRPAGGRAGSSRSGRKSRWTLDYTAGRVQARADGSLDTGFGASGIFELAADEYGRSHRGAALALEPDGRIVIAGARQIAWAMSS